MRNLGGCGRRVLEGGLWKEGYLQLLLDPSCRVDNAITMVHPHAVSPDSVHVVGLGVLTLRRRRVR